MTRLTPGLLCCTLLCCTSSADDGATICTTEDSCDAPLVCNHRIGACQETRGSELGAPCSDVGLCRDGSHCELDPGPDQWTCVQDAPCNQSSAPDNACTYDLRLHSSCATDVAEAFVLIDDHRCAETMKADDTSFTPCQRILPGLTSTIRVRGGQWIWGPLTRDCPADGGEIQTLVFECQE